MGELVSLIYIVIILTINLYLLTNEFLNPDLLIKGL
jgi:hypothetical protein